MMKSCGTLLCVMAVWVLRPCLADVTLPAIFSDNMVLQQRASVNVWGKADPEESVTVQIGSESSQATARKDGTWSVSLGGLKSGGPYEMTVFGKNSVTIHNVAIGEVWLCAGESNMELKTGAIRDAETETADCSLPMVRVFVVRHAAAGMPQADCQGAWIVCTPETARILPAIACLFGRHLNRGMRVPVGLIQSAWGPSPIEAWTPLAALEKEPALKPALERYKKAVEAYPAARSGYQAKLVEWNTAAAAAKAAGSPPPHAPLAPLDPAGPRQPAALYNGMIAPIQRYPIRGALWYQGETNTSHPADYRLLLPAMIQGWRAVSASGAFPFFEVQLPGFLARQAEPRESRWAELREAQAAALALPKAGMAVAIDLGDERNIHPLDKQDVAARLALLADAQVYGRGKGEAASPMYAKMAIDGGQAAIEFTHAGSGLVAKDGGAVRGFAIAGEDRRFVWAGATIKGSKVIVQSKDVPRPVAVRYAWADNPDANLQAKSGLPAAPFRTDTWVLGQADAPAPNPVPAPAPAHARKAKHRKAVE